MGNDVACVPIKLYAGRLRLFDACINQPPVAGNGGLLAMIGCRTELPVTTG